MKIPTQIQGIEVFYDGRCGMCCSFHEWVNRQPRAFGVEFIAYQAARAEEVRDLRIGKLFQLRGQQDPPLLADPRVPERRRAEDPPDGLQQGHA